MRFIKLFSEVLENLGGALKCSARGRSTPQRADLLLHRELVPRQLPGELGQLTGDEAPNSENSSEGEQHYENHCCCPW